MPGVLFYALFYFMLVFCFILFCFISYQEEKSWRSPTALSDQSSISKYVPRSVFCCHSNYHEPISHLLAWVIYHYILTRGPKSCPAGPYFSHFLPHLTPPISSFHITAVSYLYETEITHTHSSAPNPQWTSHTGKCSHTACSHTECYVYDLATSISCLYLTGLTSPFSSLNIPAIIPPSGMLYLLLSLPGIFISK